jgi:hypothetical protein
VIRRGAPLLLLATACAAVGPEPGALPEEPPGALVTTGEIPGSFRLRQQIHYAWQGGEGSLEAVVQKRCDELAVVGFSPLGARAFTIVQRGLDVEVESRMSGPAPFSPRFVLLDVHRAYLLPLPDPPPSDGLRELRRGEEIHRERWSRGRLLERAIARVSGAPAGWIVVTYPGGAAPGSRPPRVVLENGWYGYRLEIDTIENEELACPG